MSKDSALFVGSWQKVLIKVILLLLVLFVVYSLIKKIFKKKPKSQLEVEDFIQNELPHTTPVDNSTQNDPATISDSESELVANGLQNAMMGWGTSDDVLYGLDCYNGASLNKIYSSFGVREYDGWNPYDTPEMLDLFGWFGNELSNTSGEIRWNGDNCVPNCTSILSMCGELTYQRNIWSKSSIPVTF